MAPVCKRRKIPVSGEMVLFKAQEFARVCDCKNIEKLDINWINQSKVREEIVCKKLHGEAESDDQFGVVEW